MKKNLLYLAIFVVTVIFFISCTNDRTDYGDREPSGDVFTTLVTLDEARTAVESMMSVMPSTRTGNPRAIAEEITVGGFGATRSGDAPEEPLYYIFNFSGDDGFALASGDRRTPPVFCITESGALRPGMEIDNPGLAMTILSYDTDYRVAVGLPVIGVNGGIVNPGDPDYPSVTLPPIGVPDWGGGAGGITLIKNEYPWVESCREGPFIPVSWNQNSPYNDLMDFKNSTERYYAGCGAVAVAQVLSHYSYPFSINGYSLNWTLLKRHISGLGTPGSETNRNIARLFHELNTKDYLDVEYKDDGTSTATNRIEPTFKRLGFQCDKKADYDVFAMSQSIKAGRPVIVSGKSFRTPVKALGIIWYFKYDGGHCWVCDHLITHSQKVEWINKATGKVVKTDNRELLFVHCNWGWDTDDVYNSCNGYFLSTNFNVNERKDITRQEGVGGYYQYLLSMWHMISR